MAPAVQARTITTTLYPAYTSATVGACIIMRVCVCVLVYTTMSVSREVPTYNMIYGKLQLKKKQKKPVYTDKVSRMRI